MFGPKPEIKIDKDLVLNDYSIGDTLIYKSVDAFQYESFLVTSFFDGIDYMYESQEILLGFSTSNSKNSRSFSIYVIPDQVFISYNRYAVCEIMLEDPRVDTIINNEKYRDLYIPKFNSDGTSDTLIKKILYSGNTRIVGYKFENGEEFLLEKTIAAKD